ncbi:MAG: phosphoglycerate dehydrogenase [Clostridiales bacterium]|jgi:D-3-phosphoglycerate dehydrogenase|nr:phosphoglycerate dehydrogenase [Clostridiales bacterium]
MYNILTLNKISKNGLARFNKDKFAIGDDTENPDGIIVRSATMHDMTLSENLLAIARAGAGVNNIPIDKCTEKGIVVFNTPGANANAVKELVITALLLSSRKIIPSIDWCKTLKGQGDDVPSLVEKGKSAFVGPEIYGKTLGVVGLGAIGVLVANAAHALGMEVLGYDPFLSVDAAWNLSHSIKHINNLDELIEKSDYISLHLPLNNDTRGMINKGSIKMMKDGVRIMNFARGELVNSEDLLTAMRDGKITAYATDFPDDNLIDESGVIAIPHLGASTPESEENCASMASLQLADFLESGNITNSVNFPNVELPKPDGARIAIIHDNIPNMINQVTAAFSKESVNIENLVNKSKGNIAYTLIDTENIISESILDILKKIDCVKKIRVIK